VFELPADGEYDREEADRAEIAGIHLAGSRPPLFLIRTWYGELEHERAIARVLGPEQPIVSVGPLRGKKLEDFPSDAHEWAEVALGRLLDLPGATPRRIGGWSMGGVLAYEVAQRLARRGQALELVAMLDSGVPSQRPDPKRKRVHRSPFHRAVRHLDQFLEERTWPKRREYLRGRWERRRRKLAERAERIRDRLGLAKPQAPTPVRGFDPTDGSYVTVTGERIPLLQRTIWVSYRKYRPTRSDFPVLLLRTAKTQAESGDASLGWAPHLGGNLRSVLVPGDHFTMFEPPNVQVVARELASALADADAR
jgi:phthiocerol/phenolphthiocerol synthesis type-I polyketide synthase D